MKLSLPLDVDSIEKHEIMMTDVNYLIDQYWEYLVEHYEGTPSEVIERLVYSHSDALWTAILGKTIQVKNNYWSDLFTRIKLRVLWWVNDMRLLWGDW